MKTVAKRVPSTTIVESATLTLGEYAHAVIQAQYWSIVKLEEKVLADNDPEHLHHMRVGTRKLRTALQVFERAIALPKAAQSSRIGWLAKILGNLRDLDVQLDALRNIYRPLVEGTEQSLLDEVIEVLSRQRRKAFAATEEGLTRSRYKDLKLAYETWLSYPQYTPLAQLPLTSLLPDLLSPLLSMVLLHPGWLVPATNLSEETAPTLHDLRKACKQVRYEAEFFGSFYGKPFQTWIDEIKMIQTNLGRLQDSEVLLDLLAAYLPKRSRLPGLQTAIHQAQAAAMTDWEPLRQQYLDPKFRYHLHGLLLKPNVGKAGQAKASAIDPHG